VAGHPPLDTATDDTFKLLDEPDGFDRAVYAATFGPYLRTYAAGYKELVRLFHLAHPKSFKLESLYAVIAGWHMVAAQNVPAEWRQQFDKDAYWDKFKPEAIFKACRGERLRFDRACQSIKALELAFKYSALSGLQAIDVCSFVRLRPAIYSLADPEARAWLEHGGDPIHEDLVKELCAGRKESIARKAGPFLKQVARGRTVTHVNAMRIRAHLKVAGYKTATFSAIISRAGERPCPDESCFVTLAPKLAEELRRQFEAAQSSA
jgi:hypothetical protein